MDDSVIKVLRRNGSWQKTSQVKKENSKNRFQSREKDTEFLLDQKFGVLAQEIKKRMKIKSESSDTALKTNENDKPFNNTKRQNENYIVSSKVKARILPYLLDIQQLANERALLEKNINQIDIKLQSIKNNIEVFRKEYEQELKNMQKNIDFFEHSLDLIDDIKGGEK
ncbi:MAG: hypothetical protein CMP24_04840 [Rickettsiales bacterium]|nr:hypothetical protein [Rickettsiales bacterium]